MKLAAGLTVAAVRGIFNSNRGTFVSTACLRITGQAAFLKGGDFVLLRGNNKAYGRWARLFVVVLLIPLVFGFCIARASCATWTAENEIAGEAPYDLTEYGDGVGDVYEMLVNIAFPLAAVSFAAGAFRMITGGERDIESGQKQMIMTLLALAAIIMLPLAVKAGMTLGKTYGWSPP